MNKKIVQELRGIVEYLEKCNIDHLQRETMRNAADIIERLTWISVKERLPECRGYYLAAIERTAPEELGGNSTNVKIMRWMGEDWRYAYHIPEWINKEIMDKVTHWMPLPELPKEALEKLGDEA